MKNGGYGLNLPRTFRGVALVVFHSMEEDTEIYMQEDETQFVLWANFNKGVYQRFDLRLL